MEGTGFVQTGEQRVWWEPTISFSVLCIGSQEDKAGVFTEIHDRRTEENGY